MHEAYVDLEEAGIENHKIVKHGTFANLEKKLPEYKE